MAPRMNIRRRPKRSPNRPPSTSNPANVSRLALRTHWASVVPTPDCFSMDGTARGTAV